VNCFTQRKIDWRRQSKAAGTATLGDRRGDDRFAVNLSDRGISAGRRAKCIVDATTSHRAIRLRAAQTGLLVLAPSIACLREQSREVCFERFGRMPFLREG